MRKSTYARCGQIIAAGVGLGSISTESTGGLVIGASIMLFGGLGLGMLSDYLEKREDSNGKQRPLNTA